MVNLYVRYNNRVVRLDTKKEALDIGVRRMTMKI